MSEPAKKKQRPNETWRCKHCGLPARHIVGSKSATQADLRGNHLVHQRLCLGVDADGNPLGLPPECPACLLTFHSPSPKAWLCHWAKCQPQKKLSDTYTLKDIRLDFSRHLLPSTDMNSKFGLALSRKMALWHDKELLGIQSGWGGDQIKALYAAEGLFRSLREDFRSFFQGAIPIQLASHVSSIQPTTILSSIARLELSSPMPPSPLTEQQRLSANVAVVDYAYGAGSGPLATHSPIVSTSAIACGPKPVLLARKDVRIYAQLRKKLAAAKRTQHIFGVLVEMVSSCDGRVLTMTDWNSLAKVCEELGLYLIVDEAQTAIRCGKPFAHHEDKYAHIRPSFVLFGKGIRTAGLAVYPDGITVSKLGYHRDDEALQEVLTMFDHQYAEIGSPPDILEAWAVVRLARREDWPGRARRIGENIRRTLRDVFPERAPPVGPAAMMFLGRCKTRGAGITGASAGLKIRWFPLLDEGMDSYDTVRSLFGPGSQSLRQELVDRTKDFDPYCVLCGDNLLDAGGTRCATCKGTVCGFCKEDDKKAVKLHLDGLCLAG